MSESIELRPPLPDQLRGARLTWLSSAKGTTATTRERAVAALLERQLASGFDDQVRLSVAEADEFLRQVDIAQGRRPRPAPKPAPRKAPPATTPRPAPRRAPTPSTPTSGGGRVAAGNRTTCHRCGGHLRFSGPRHVVHIEDLDAFYRRTFDPRSLATTTVYEYECTGCHGIAQFTTAQ